ncbi:MAG TPA: zf-TFIIB domain-containing protein [Pyrinomonadaceae bacterium]|nr:zf-TFIIB domain-containing protein [Pyrinomonadaceae bacterium]
MSDIFDERRRGLEEEYFRRQNREALERLRAKRAAEGGPEREAQPRQCPLGHGTLSEMAYQDVIVDRCEVCRGIWLDAGELEHLTGREGGGFLGWLFGDRDKE